MKKLTSLLLALLATIALTACNETSTEESDSTYTSQLIKASVLDYDSADDGYANLQSFEITPTDTALFLEADENTVLVDVRGDSEYTQGHIKGAVHIPLGELSRGSLMSNNIGFTDNIITYCSSGNRSAQAYQILQSLGYYNSNSMAGGITAWARAGLPVTTE